MAFLLRYPMQAPHVPPEFKSQDMENTTLMAILGLLAVLVAVGLIFIDITSSMVKNPPGKAESVNTEVTQNGLTGF